MWKKIYAAPNAAEAEVIISFLRANGFHPLELQISPHIFFAGADLWYFVQVPSEEAELAREVLKSNKYCNLIT